MLRSEPVDRHVLIDNERSIPSNVTGNCGVRLVGSTLAREGLRLTSRADVEQEENDDARYSRGVHGSLRFDGPDGYREEADKEA